MKISAALFAVMFCCFSTLSVQDAEAQERFSRPRTSVNQAAANSRQQFGEAQFEEYERQLNALLLTRIDAEKAFVAGVVDKVQTGAIPSRLVQTSFQWVRVKRPHTRYPFVFFEKVIRLQAAQLGLEEEIPAFDYDSYIDEITRR